METTFTTYQHKVTNENLETAFSTLQMQPKTLDLNGIQLLPSGHGHYSIEASFHIDGKPLIIKTRTSNMELVDAWKDGMHDNFQNHHFYDSWDDVVRSMLNTIDPDNEIFELLYI